MSVIPFLKANWIYILILMGAILLGLVAFYYFTRPSDDTDPFDDSDCPIPPSTLEYNRTLCPTKRNTDLPGSSGIQFAGNRSSRIQTDYLGNTYYPIPGDVYSL